jgi:hypothetical protein
MDFLEIIQNYGPYIGLPVIIYFLVNGFKTKIPFFKTVLGLRLLHFLPVVLGCLGGLLLPEDTWQDKILTGGGLGCLNILIYKFITVTLGKQKDLEAKVAQRNSIVNEE